MIIVKCEKCGSEIHEGDHFYAINEMKVGETGIFDPQGANKIHVCMKCRPYLEKEIPKAVAWEYWSHGAKHFTDDRKFADQNSTCNIKSLVYGGPDNG